MFFWFFWCFRLTCLSPHCCKTTNPWALAWLSCLIRSACEAADGEAWSVTCWLDTRWDWEALEVWTTICGAGFEGRLTKFVPLRATVETEVCWTCGRCWVGEVIKILPFVVSRGSDLTTRPGSVLMTGFESRLPKANWNFGSVPGEGFWSSVLIGWPDGVSWKRKIQIIRKRYSLQFSRLAITHKTISKKILITDTLI